MSQIFDFPPVAIVGWRPTVERRVRVSRFSPGNEMAVSSDGPARRIVDLSVSALGKERAGYGYMEELWSLIDGGVGFVRLALPPVNWHLDWLRLQASVGNAPLKWSHNNDPLNWTADGAPLNWFLKTIRMGQSATIDGQPAMEVSGLPAGVIVARPGDILRIWSADHTDLGAAKVRNLVRPNSNGDAVVILDAPLPSGIAAFADEEQAVFRMTAYDPQAWGIGANTTINCSLREALPHELDGVTDGYTPW